MPKTDTNELELGVTIRGVAAEQKLFGRYTLRKVLGRGGMGIVWLAHDDELKRNVAMKFLPDMIIRDREAVEDLKRETRRSLDLTHHHIVRIYDFTQDDTCAAIVMEYVDGDSLSALKTHQPTGCFGVSALQVWAGHFCQALDYAHRQARVVHRDLKPANLMVNSRGDLKVTDFGISRSMSDSMTRVSISNSAGTLAYMSPEQALGAPPAVGDDIYAFGATIYDLLTGRPPFFRGNLQVQLETVIPPLMDARRTELGNSGEPIPALWEEVIAACLSKRPQDRPHSMSEIANLLGVGGSSSSGTGATHGGFGGGIPGTSRTSFAPGTSTTDRTISPEEMVTAPVRSRPSSPVGPRTATQGPPPVPTRAEDVFLNIAPARTPTAPPAAPAPPSTSATAPRIEPTIRPAPTNRTAPPSPVAPIERITPAPPSERAVPIAPVERITSPAPSAPSAPVEHVAPAAPAEQSAPVPEPEVAEAPVPIPEPVIPEAIAPEEVIAPPASPPVPEKIPEAVALTPAPSPAPPRVADDELIDEPMTMPAVARKRVSESVAPAAKVEPAPVPVATPESPASAGPPRIPEPAKPFPAPSVPPYQGVGHMIGTPRKKSAAPLIAAGIGAIVLIGGFVAWYAGHDKKPITENVVPAPAPPAPPPVPTESETLTAKAKELREDGKLQEARLALSRALALDPANNAAANLLEQVDQALAEKKMSADLDAKKDVLARVDAALQASDYLNAKRLIETVPQAHADDPDVVAKKGDIERMETNARIAMEKKNADEQRLASEKAAEAEAKRKADAAEEAQRIAAANRKKKADEEEQSKKKTAGTSKKKSQGTDDAPPAVRVVRPPQPVAPPPPRVVTPPFGRTNPSKPRNPYIGGAPGG